MEVFDAVRTVLAVREFQDKPVPAEVIRRVADAAHLTASSSNRQPWHFVFVEDRATLLRLGELCTSGKYTAGAAFAVVVGADEEARYGNADTARAIQSMVLTAWADGVGSNWVGVPNPDETRALLGIPATVNLVGIVPFGYPVKRLGLGKKNRKPFNEVVHLGRFGQPFA